MVPIHLIRASAQPENAALPNDALCFLVGSNGTFKQIHNAFYSARIKTNAVTGLSEIAETAKLHVPKLPLHIFQEVEAFFIAVYKRFHSEAVVLLMADPIREEWRIAVPPQSVRSLHVQYDLSRLPAPPDGFQRFGTIHSHAGAKAFHSGTDDSDELCFDGLHITIGNVNQPARSYAARWMLAGKAFPVELAEVVDDPVLPEADPAWLEQVREIQCVPQRNSEFFLPAECDPFGFEDFRSPEEYRAYLEEIREDVDERLRDVETAFAEDEK